MSSTAHISYEQPVGRETPSAKWGFDNGAHTLIDLRVGPANRSLAHFAPLAVSSMTSAPDPWFSTQRQCSVLTTGSTFQTSSRRRITPLEARRMALDILRRAEAGRAAAAEAEAKQGIDWEEVA